MLYHIVITCGVSPTMQVIMDLGSHGLVTCGADNYIILWKVCGGINMHQVCGGINVHHLVTSRQLDLTLSPLNNNIYSL